ncbi:MFS transporter [Marinomonas balearica]|uniref:MFS transporter n=1 Tax=Marinomonas balearica TaxID=491947 RepID=A0A4R6M7V4_9GAMM|nr:MFS transporter [Marinomonas balearica]TDO96710.1 MFS transporter [Marinomonas balearica]
MKNGFWILRISETLSTTANKMLISIFIWFSISYVSSPDEASSIYATYFLSKIVFGTILSPLGDRFEKRKLIFYANSLALVGFFIAVYMINQKNIYVPLFYAIVIFLGCCDAIYPPLANAILPDIVEKKNLDLAYQYTFFLQSIGSLIGISVGIISLDMLGLYVAVVLATTLSIVSQLILLFLNVAKEKPIIRSESLTYMREIKESFILTYKYKSEFYWNLAASLANFIVAPIISIAIPFFVSHILMKDGGYVVFYEVCISFGVILGALYVQKKLIYIGVKKMTLVKSSFSFMGISILLLALFDNYIVWGGALLFLGLSIIVCNICVESVRSIAIPKQYRSRLQTIHILTILSSTPLGFLLMGNWIESYSLQSLLFAFGLILLVVSQFIIHIPKMEHLLSMEEDELEGAYASLFCLPNEADKSINLKET